LTRRGWTIEYILQKLTLKQIYLIWKSYERNIARELKQKAVVEFLSIAGGMGSKKAIDELKRILYNDNEENVEYI